MHFLSVRHLKSKQGAAGSAQKGKTHGPWSSAGDVVWEGAAALRSWDKHQDLVYNVTEKISFFSPPFLSSMFWPSFVWISSCGFEAWGVDGYLTCVSEAMPLLPADLVHGSFWTRLQAQHLVKWGRQGASLLSELLKESPCSFSENIWVAHALDVVRCVLGRVPRRKEKGNCFSDTTNKWELQEIFWCCTGNTWEFSWLYILGISSVLCATQRVTKDLMIQSHLQHLKHWNYTHLLWATVGSMQG